MVVPGPPSSTSVDEVIDEILGGDLSEQQRQQMLDEVRWLAAAQASAVHPPPQALSARSAPTHFNVWRTYTITGGIPLYFKCS
jgi:hypothetical protein